MTQLRTGEHGGLRPTVGWQSDRVSDSDLVYRFKSYRRSGNFRVKYISPFNFLRCFIFVARAHRRKLNHAKISFTRTRIYVHIPGTGYHVAPLERSWSVGSARARECSRHPCRITDREGTVIGYLPRKISPVCFGPRFQLPSEVRFRDRALGWKSSAIFQDREHHRQVSGSAAEPYLYFDSRKLTRLVES